MQLLTWRNDRKTLLIKITSFYLLIKITSFYFIYSSVLFFLLTIFLLTYKLEGCNPLINVDVLHDCILFPFFEKLSSIRINYKNIYFTRKDGEHNLTLALCWGKYIKARISRKTAYSVQIIYSKTAAWLRTSIWYTRKQLGKQNLIPKSLLTGVNIFYQH